LKPPLFRKSLTILPESATSLAVLADGRIVLSGYRASTGEDFALARYIAATPVEALSFSVE
jgi:hypothetical protein